MTNYITKGIGGFYYVKTETGIVECRARGIFRKRGITPVAGDQVVLSADRTTIDEILPRKNVFIRPPVANLDVLFIVASTTQPVPSTLILDELTAAAVYKDVQPVIVITKADLAAADALEKAYADSTIPLIRLDYDTGEGLDQIRARIAGNLCAFCGNSGVGKSTLLNALAPQLERQTGGISQKLGRGRHTTREVEIFEVCGGLLADTPGFASLDANKICRIPPDFRIFWDNAYCVHDLYPNAPAVLPDILSACANAGHPDMVYEFCSTSKVSFPGAGISGVAASSANLIDLRKVWKFATIGPDKLNQLRQARFFRNESGIEAHMARHARLLRPKFEQVISIFREELDGSGIASWTEPRGGYFLSFDTMPGCAARTVELCRRAGVKFTPAGSTWPYGRDPQDSNIRIAPSFASAEEIEPAARLFTICVRLATLEKLAATRFASETALGAERIA